jgi:pimeloyl-ACP methyl ester carboxylesterase
MNAAIRPFRIAIPQGDLDDLRARLGRTRWPDDLPGVGDSYGMPLGDLKPLVEYWRSGYDWRRHEARLNEYPQFTTTLDGDKIHFLQVISPEPNALPLILNLGWPSSQAELLPIIGPLVDPREHGGDPADAFHLVAPSLPGFGFSGPTRTKGWTTKRVATAWLELMTRLGYDRFGAQGSDWGAMVMPELGRLAPERLIGIHLNALVMGQHNDPDAAKGLNASEQARLERQNFYISHRLGYAQIQSTRPQTLAYGLNDSPAGLLAWNFDLFDYFGKAAPGSTSIDREDILTSVSIYWFTETEGSSARIYREAAEAFAPQPRSPVPTGVAVFAGDSTIRKFAEPSHNIVHWSEFDRGGHYASVQAPDLLVSDIRAFFKSLR